MTTKSFPSLYAKNKQGAWKEWQISVHMDPRDNRIPQIKTQYGRFQGKLITETQCITTLKRGYKTLWDQAVFAAQSKWNHKHNREHYTTTMAETIMTTTTITKPYSPMLAKTFAHGKHLRFPLYIQPKIDGVRCLAHPFGLFSRTGCPFHGLDAIVHELETYFATNGQGCVVDGELYSEGMSFEELSGCCRRRRHHDEEEDTILDKTIIMFHVFDVIPPTGLLTTMTFEDRLHLFPPETEHIRWVPTTQIQHLEQIEPHLKAFVEKGYEGIMLRNKQGVYQVGHRSWDLQKYKLFHEEEFEITGFTEGTGREKGLVIWECQTHGGKKFHVRPEGTHEQRRHMFQQASSYVGKTLTVVFQEYTQDKVPRFPVAKAIREHY